MQPVTRTSTHSRRVWIILIVAACCAIPIVAGAALLWWSSAGYIVITNQSSENVSSISLLTSTSNGTETRRIAQLAPGDSVTLRYVNSDTVIHGFEFQLRGTTYTPEVGANVCNMERFEIKILADGSVKSDYLPR